MNYQVCNRAHTLARSIRKANHIKNLTDIEIISLSDQTCMICNILRRGKQSYSPVRPECIAKRFNSS